MEVFRIRHYGDCLEPLGITDGTPLIGMRVTDWKTDDCNLLKYQGKCVGIKLKGINKGLMKVLANYDILEKKLYLMQLKPQKIMCFGLDEIEDILILEKDNGQSK